MNSSYENVLKQMKPNSQVSSQLALSASNNSSPICQARKKGQAALLKASADRPPVMNKSIEKDSFVIRTVSTNKEKDANGDICETV